MILFISNIMIGTVLLAKILTTHNLSILFFVFWFGSLVLLMLQIASMNSINSLSLFYVSYCCLAFVFLFFVNVAVLLLEYSYKPSRQI